MKTRLVPKKVAAYYCGSCGAVHLGDELPFWTHFELRAAEPFWAPSPTARVPAGHKDAFKWSNDARTM